ncbi:MAG: 2-phosphosulfolactate phosphatase [Tannerella sp.]|jgi:2-phosphosulfolactate phosphatase|nr:2-phosphosulfolactate phosphatase [Tannerella sp.]
MTVDVCFSPALYPYYHKDDAVVVIVDVFRATTTITAAFENGARSIRPVATVEEAEICKAKGLLVGAERHVRRCAFADFGNSPYDYTPAKVAGKDIVFTTTNGTKAINCAARAHRILTGAFVNLQAVAHDCTARARDVVVLCSGWEDRINIEDTLFGGALSEALLTAGYLPAGDAARIALSLWMDAKSDLHGYIERTEHFKRLLENGLENDISYCLTPDTSSLVPVYSTASGVLLPRKPGNFES